MNEIDQVHDETVITYTVDADDRITSVCDSWPAWAVRNQAPSLALTDRVIGRRLPDFIAGDETRRLHIELFKAARDGRTLKLPFRCDSPRLKRFMEMTITPLDDGALRFEGRILRVEPRPYQAVLDASMTRSEQWLTLCAWCKRARENGTWAELDAYVAARDGFGAEGVPQITHGVCDDCRVSLAREIAKARGD